MADLSQIFAQSLFSDPGVGADAELNAFKNTLNQNNYWNMAAAPVLGAKFNTSTWSPATTLGVTAGQSFIGSLLQGLGAQSNARQVEAISSILPQLQADPVNTPLPAGVDAEAGAALRSSLIRDMFKRDQQVAQALATKGIKVGADGSWATVPGARDALNALDGISPELQAVEAKVRSGAELSAADNAILAAAPNSAKRIIDQVNYQNMIGDRAEATQGRFDKTFGFKQGEREIPGYKNVTDSVLPLSTVNGLREKASANEEVKTALRALKESGDSEGFMQLMGTNAQFQAAMQSSIFNAYRKRTGSGARLEGPEGDMIKSMTPAVLSGDIFAALKAGAMGRDQNEFIDSMVKFLDEDKDLSFFQQGLVSNSRPLSFYPKEDVKKFGLEQLLDEPSSMGAKNIAAPTTAQYSEQELQGAGYSAADIAALRAQGKVK